MSRSFFYPTENLVTKLGDEVAFKWKYNKEFVAFQFYLESKESPENRKKIELQEPIFNYVTDRAGIYHWKVIPYLVAKHGTKIQPFECAHRTLIVKKGPVKVGVYFGQSALKYSTAVLRELNDIEEGVSFEEVSLPFPPTVLLVELFISIRLDEMLKTPLYDLSQGGAKEVALLALRSGLNTTQFDDLPKAQNIVFQTELVVHPYITTSVVHSGKPEVTEKLHELVKFFMNDNK